MTVTIVRFSSSEDCEQLNTLMFQEVFPVPPQGTTGYLACEPHPTNGQCLTVLDNDQTSQVLNFAETSQEVAALIVDQITYEQAVAAGWWAEE